MFFMDNYQGTHKRAYKNFRAAGKVLLPIGIVFAAVFTVTFIVFLSIFITEASVAGASKTDLSTLGIVSAVGYGVSILFMVLGYLALIPGIVFTALAHGFRSRDEGHGIDYSEFDK
jgi:hypothetical protein